MLNIVLYQPEIPHNTGAIARTCALLTAHLHLIHPYGFQLRDRRMKRASMDYLDDAPLTEHVDWAAFAASVPPGANVWLFSGRGRTVYSQVRYSSGDYLVFGRESDGMPEDVLGQFPNLAIPMPGALPAPRTDHRQHSLNLSVSVGIAAYEAMRQVTNNWQSG